ncbi:cytotardin-like isoform X1 [Vigna unguiculata]|uniref:cytotardin-like isoform X1 n=1 Tax=Vigna unguiculata TaxID=3917 RepID=UPI0010160C5A|nr:cytotardin-like isoform X1 [Vigna unguiculata]XP_027929033.1 cytotardin-like isoform X1 [Vigna unguiculata]XP_027929034.1 cytotardin-like isoform X1 [Vigna unguiculata]XP_027929035.1 cytotardin-like isoform X1 [Vigna unguiculata]
MDVNNFKTQLKKHSDNISALERNMQYSGSINMLMKNLSVKIESSHAQHSEAIGALGQEDEELLSDVKSMKTEREMIRGEMKEINKTLEKLKTDKMEGERLLGEAYDRISMLDAEMETSKKSTTDTIAGMDYDKFKTQQKEHNNHINALEDNLRYDRRVMNILLKDIKEEIEMFHCKRSTDLEALMQENEELLLLLLSEVESGKTKKQMCENIKHG